MSAYPMLNRAYVQYRVTLRKTESRVTPFPSPCWLSAAREPPPRLPASAARPPASACGRMDRQTDDRSAATAPAARALPLHSYHDHQLHLRVGSRQSRTPFAARAPRCFDRRDEAGAAEAPLAGRVVASDPTDRGIDRAMTTGKFLTTRKAVHVDAYDVGVTTLAGTTIFGI